MKEWSRDNSRYNFRQIGLSKSSSIWVIQRPVFTTRIRPTAREMFFMMIARRSRSLADRIKGDMGHRVEPYMAGD
jgi:hypothetical protein